MQLFIAKVSNSLKKSGILTLASLLVTLALPANNALADEPKPIDNFTANPYTDHVGVEASWDWPNEAESSYGVSIVVDGRLHVIIFDEQAPLGWVSTFVRFPERSAILYPEPGRIYYASAWTLKINPDGTSSRTYISQIAETPLQAETTTTLFVDKKSKPGKIILSGSTKTNAGVDAKTKLKTVIQKKYGGKWHYYSTLYTTVNGQPDDPLNHSFVPNGNSYTRTFKARRGIWRAITKRTGTETHEGSSSSYVYWTVK